jgi:hypothetical protein
VNPVLRETLAILFWSFWSSAGIAALGALVLGWPLTATYLMAVLTIGPALAILRGRNRENDALDIGERAGVEILALVILLAIGWAAGRYLGR